MIIRKMTASFGRLEKDTLSLREGLNILQAPNEWGKSTWCAFLRCMLYGVDTSQREKAGRKPDKLRYAPWSGAPMAGVMELRWRGREICLRRETRVSTAPMREFTAVYSADGEPVSRLAGSDAGELLTGVSEEVFRRTAFIAQGSLAVASGAELEKKIAGLFTAGEEDASFTEAAQRLKNWQRRRRWRTKGRLPEIETELEQLGKKLSSMEELRRELAEAEEQIRRLESQQEQVRQQQQTEQSSRREEALICLEKAQSRRQKLEETALLRRQEARERRAKLEGSPFGGQPPEMAAQRVEEDVAAAKKQKTRPGWGWVIPVLLVLGCAAVLGGIYRVDRLLPVGFGILGVCGLSGFAYAWQLHKKAKTVSPVYRAWGVASEYELRQVLQQYSADWRAAEAAQRLAQQVQQEAERAMQEQKAIHARVAGELGAPGQTTDRLHEIRQRLQKLLENKTALQTRLDLLGDPLVLTSRIQQLKGEHTRLEEEYEALELALTELEEAGRTLQSEFSPRLACRTAYWMARLTGGRYSEVTLNRELQAMVRAAEEMLSRESDYLSGGTADQLYLALRLALCELVLPEEDPCPLILDDALITFDDERLGYAMEALAELGKQRQILLFTCQDREARYMQNRNRGGEL